MDIDPRIVAGPVIGDGETPEPAPPGIRGDLMLAARAVRWGMSPEERARWREIAWKWAKDSRSRIALRALALLAAIERQDQADEHLRARLQNSGLALVEARRTVETLPDGSRVETQAVKLWAVGTPMDSV